MKQKLLLLLVALLPMVANAYDAKIDGIYYNFTGNTATVTSLYEYSLFSPRASEYSGTVVIPASVTYNGKNYSVTSINDGAFYSCSGLTSITIPESVTSIGYCTFEYCSGLTSINISNSVTSIDQFAFKGCSGLTSINIPEGLTRIDDYVFSGCSNLTSITIPNSVTRIGNDAFSGCTGLTSITIPNSVTSIGANAFSGCSSLTYVTIPESVTSISPSAFRDCSGLTSITIPNSVTSIYDYAFSGCSGLTSITIPNSVTHIYNCAFSGCSGLTSVTLESNSVVSQKRGLYSMGSIFGGQVKTYIIGDAVKSVGEGAFYGCSGLTSVSIGSSVTSIGDDAFYGCSGLTSVTLESNSLVSENRSSSNSMKSIFGGQVKTYIIGDAVKSVGNCAFYVCSSLTSVSIGNSVTSIGVYAFSGCTGLTSINIPEGVTSIGSDAFSGCTGLTSINIPEGVTSIGTCAFKGCIGLTSFIIPNGVTSIENETFSGCSGLTSITIPDGVTSIGDKTFSGCSGLTSITIPNSVTSISESAFSGCSGLKSLKILSDKLTFLAANSLEGCNSCSVYVKKGTGSLLAVWAAGYEPYDITTQELLEAPNIEVQESSATTLKCNVIHSYEEYTCQLSINGKSMGTSSFYQTGLEPNQEYTVSLTIAEKKEMPISCEIPVKVMTNDLTFKTMQPKVVTEGNVVVESMSNIENDAESVGIEWRRIDWPNEFPSNSATAYLYNGTIQGYIRNLNTNYLWKFRSFYESASGNRFYSDWIGIDPTNTSYFEPSVHTYDQINVTGNTAEVKGYAMRGTDNVVSQGFMYWEGNTSVSLRRRAASVPDGAMVVKASGNIMTATLKDLEYETIYNYVAYVTTSEGETFYGEMRTFSTSADPDGIEEVKASEDAVEVARYDIQGRLIAKPQKGINIIRYSDGSTRKVMVR